MITNRKQYLAEKRLLYALCQQQRIISQRLPSTADQNRRQEALTELEARKEKLRKDLEQYDLLRSPASPLPDLKQAERLASDLIKARIVLDWSHRELAERTGVKRQQIQRYEATGYRSARFDRLITIATILAEGIAYLELSRRECERFRLERQAQPLRH